MSCFQYFKEDISNIELPNKFTYPFYYEPHPLVEIAAKELQIYIENQSDFEHNFGFNPNQKDSPLGKMFGVLIVQNKKDEIGYLAAFSGKLQDKSLPLKFVPPIFNVHEKSSFYVQGENELNQINQQIELLENASEYIELKKEVQENNIFIHNEIKKEKEKMKMAKFDRRERRKLAKENLNEKDFILFEKELTQERIKGQNVFKKRKKELLEILDALKNKLEHFETKILTLKTKRKQQSALLQEQIFNQYQFLNQEKEKKGLLEIFPKTSIQHPPAGAGDCSAPKLLQYAFSNDLKPIALGEFWWGISPKTEIRKHQHFYPSCRGRCKPILAHMLAGIDMDENPFLQSHTEGKKLEFIYEDDSILVVNKPAEFLSVPGKEISDSVYTRIKAKYPNATGPLIVHRLDMSTSGILVIAKTKEAHKTLQHQFLKRTIKKRYIALLDGVIKENEGFVDLPLRVDLDDRPRQLVCYDYGKSARTKWKVLKRLDKTTKIHLFPITGRTHQLRVHMAHSLGLNAPILGDDLYGKKLNRLHLHAEHISFIHPKTLEEVSFSVDANF